MNDTLIPDKNKALYIHIGYPKTGTTAIQTFLAINVPQLRELGVDYASPGRTCASHHNLALELLDPVLYRAELGGWSDLVSYIHNSSQTRFLISAEHLYRALSHHIEKVITLTAGIEIKIIVYLRPQAQVIQSIYLQSIREAVNNISWEEFFDCWAYGRYFRYFDVLKRWEDNGATIASVRIYDISRFKNGNIFDDFLMALGIEQTADELLLEKPVGNLNETLGAKNLALLYESCMNPSFAAAPRERRGRAQELIVALCNELGWSQEKASLLTAAQMLASTRHFEQQNISVATHYLKKEADEPLFRDERLSGGEHQTIARITDGEWVDLIVRLALLASK